MTPDERKTAMHRLRRLQKLLDVGPQVPEPLIADSERLLRESIATMTPRDLLTIALNYTRFVAYHEAEDMRDEQLAKLQN